MYALDTVSGFTFPALLDSAEQVMILPRVTKDKKTVCVTLCNTSIGDTDEMLLRIRNSAGDNFRLKNASLDIPVKAQKSGDEYIIKIPPMRGWEITTLFCL